MKTENLTAIVTGASQGIGKAVALYLASKNYKVLLVSRTKQKLQAVAADIQKQYPNSPHPEIAALDVADYAAVKTAVDNFAKENKQINFLCNNAGYAKRGTSELSHDEFLKMINTNLIGAFNFINLVIPHMKKNKGGRIINIVSRSGMFARKFLGGYAASKFGLMGFSEGIYKELAGDNIFVTALCPGFVATDMTADVDLAPELMIQPDDIVKTIDYLMQLSFNVCIPEILIECKSTVVKDNS